MTRFRLYLFAALLAPRLFAGCLVMDSIIVLPAGCASGTCGTGPGVVGGAELKAMMVPRFEAIGHNPCKTRQPVTAGQSETTWIVEIAFYDKDNYRLGINTFYVASLSAGEKFRHAYDIPADVRVLGPVQLITVRSITTTVNIPGK